VEACISLRNLSLRAPETVEWVLFLPICCTFSWTFFSFGSWLNVLQFSVLFGRRLPNYNSGYQTKTRMLFQGNVATARTAFEASQTYEIEA
jgi:hypothetical protein